jgi:hypothetical protein
MLGGEGLTYSIPKGLAHSAQRWTAVGGAEKGRTEKLKLGKLKAGACVSEGESPSSLEARLPEFGTKVMNGKV